MKTFRPKDEAPIIANRPRPQSPISSALVRRLTIFVGIAILLILWGLLR